jgi:hypothetical protein
LFQRLLDIISRVLPLNPIAGKEELLTQLNPDKIYVENVRSLLGVSKKAAEAICEDATRVGYFKRYVEVMCPDGSVALTAETEIALPELVACIDNEYGEPEEIQIPTKTLRKSVFYKLNERASVIHA